MKITNTRLQRSSFPARIDRRVIEIHLRTHEVWGSTTASGSRIACEQGIIWLTQPNDPRDHILHPGQRLLITRRGKVVIQALTAAMITVGIHKALLSA